MHPSIRENEQGLRDLCVRYGVARLELFGSAAGEAFVPGESDFDFLVEFGPLSPGEHADAYFGLLESLEELLGAPIDLVVPSTIANPYLLRTIDETRTLLSCSLNPRPIFTTY